MNFGKKLTSASLLLVAAMLALPAHTGKSSGRLQTPGKSDSSVAQKVYVRVSDFQLFASAVARTDGKARADNTAHEQLNPIYSPTDTPTMLARRLRNYFANTLLQS